MTTAEAAAVLGMSAGWVAALCRNGVLDGRKQGNKWLITADSVDKLTTDGAVEPEVVERVRKKLDENEEAKTLGAEIAGDSFKDKLIRIIKKIGGEVVKGAAMEIGKVIVEVLRSTGFLPF